MSVGYVWPTGARECCPWCCLRGAGGDCGCVRIQGDKVRLPFGILSTPLRVTMFSYFTNYFTNEI